LKINEARLGFSNSELQKWRNFQKMANSGRPVIGESLKRRLTERDMARVHETILILQQSQHGQ